MLSVEWRSNDRKRMNKLKTRLTRNTLLLKVKATFVGFCLGEASYGCIRFKYILGSHCLFSTLTHKRFQWVTELTVVAIGHCILVGINSNVLSVFIQSVLCRVLPLLFGKRPFVYKKGIYLYWHCCLYFVVGLQDLSEARVVLSPCLIFVLT